MPIIVITDSGLGGLSIAAGFYEWLRSTRRYAAQLIFANALPEAGKGYNTMSNRHQKIAIFNRFLYSTQTRFKPDLVAVACNTLSVLITATDYYQSYSSEIMEIVKTGLQPFIQKYSQHIGSNIIIFGTETTIASQSHSNYLVKAGIPADLIRAQSCPHLASEIERDPHSTQTRQIIAKAVKKAVRGLKSKERKTFAYLACTHYGYVAREFEKALQAEKVPDIEIVNPNQNMINALQVFLQSKIPPEIKIDQNPTTIKVVSRAQILPQEIISITRLIRTISPDTVTALTHYQRKPDLF